MDLRIPQVRESSEPFYPQSLDRGLRSERALKIALAEMYIQGVSTRNVAAITGKLCGFSVTSMSVRQDGVVRDAAVLIAIGVDTEGKRQILGGAGRIGG